MDVLHKFWLVVRHVINDKVGNLKANSSILNLKLSKEGIKRHSHKTQLLSVAYLNMPVNEVVEFVVVIIFAEWIDQCLGNFEPTHKEGELKSKEEGEVKV